MTQPGKLLNSGLALILVTSSGCAGNGLRNIFSRNETSGYRTLEELEQKRLAQEEADKTASSPRFASWLPFGTKTSEEANSVATHDGVTEPGAKSGGWWKNPFRRQDTVEADPFLEAELPTEVIVAGKQDSEDSEDVTDRSAVERSPTRPLEGKVIKTISGTSDHSEDSEEELLVDKFEQHFHKKTTDTAEVADDLAVSMTETEQSVKKSSTATKAVDTTTASANAAAEAKLAEFEQLISEKKTAAKKLRETARMPEAEVADEPMEDFAAILENSKRSVKQAARKTQSQASQSVEEFGGLFETVEETGDQSVATANRSLAGRRTSALKETETKEIEVARAAEIFGAEAEPDGGWKAEPKVTTSNTARRGRSETEPSSDRARQVMGSTLDHAASMFSGTGRAPAAMAPDTDAWVSADAMSDRSAQASVRNGGAIRMASSEREFPLSLNTPAGLQEDNFFSGNGTASPGAHSEVSRSTAVPAPAVVAHAVQASEKKDAGTGIKLPSTFRLRNALLVLGGIIVAALVFAPGRKKPIQANQTAVQG